MRSQLIDKYVDITWLKTNDIARISVNSCTVVQIDIGIWTTVNLKCAEFSFLNKIVVLVKVVMHYQFLSGIDIFVKLTQITLLQPQFCFVH